MSRLATGSWLGHGSGSVADGAYGGRFRASPGLASWLFGVGPPLCLPGLGRARLRSPALSASCSPSLSGRFGWSRGFGGGWVRVLVPPLPRFWRVRTGVRSSRALTPDNRTPALSRGFQRGSGRGNGWAGVGLGFWWVRQPAVGQVPVPASGVGVGGCWAAAVGWLVMVPAGCVRARLSGAAVGWSIRCLPLGLAVSALAPGAGGIPGPSSQPTHRHQPPACPPRRAGRAVSAPRHRPAECRRSPPVESDFRLLTGGILVLPEGFSLRAGLPVRSPVGARQSGRRVMVGER